MELVKIATPGFMISQGFPNTYQVPGAVADAVESALKFGFYEHLQILDVQEPSERRHIAATIQRKGVTLTYCVTRRMGQQKLSLASLDLQVRKQAVDMVLRCIEEAQEAGAASLAVISGAYLEGRREESLEMLKKSMAEICKRPASVSIVLEPLDWKAHKKNALGTTREALLLSKELGKEINPLFLCVDTAHRALNGEGNTELLAEAVKYMKEFHFCNCVLDPASELFGDRHLPLNVPDGFLTETVMAEIMKDLYQNGYFGKKKGIVMFEILNEGQWKPEEMLKEQKEVLLSVWEKANQ